MSGDYQYVNENEKRIADALERIADSLEKLVDYKIKVASGQVVVPSTSTQSNKLNIPDAVEQAMLGNIGSHD